MADTPEPKGGGKSTFGFLGKKVFGKVPVWVIAVGAVGGWYWYTHYGPGKKAAQQQGQPQTDPAGNVCAQINPDTGYCPGSVEDTAALQSQAAAAGGGGTGDGGAAGAGTGAGTAGAPGPAGPPGPPGPPGPVFPGVNKPPPPLPPPPTSNWPGGRQPPPPHPGPPPRRRPPPPPRNRRQPPRPRLPVEFSGGPVRGLQPQPVPPPVRVYAPGTTGSVYARPA